MTDEELLSGFRSQAISKEQWTHRAHVRTAYLHLRDGGSFDDALEKMRDGIKQLNLAVGGENTATAGYHETITVAFLRLVAAMIRHYGAGTSETSSDAFCDAHPQLLSKYVLRLYYTRDVIDGTEARTRFVAPNIAPLP